MCHGEPVSKEDVPPCYDEDAGVWENVSLQEFMDCPSNWAANRQARFDLSGFFPIIPNAPNTQSGNSGSYNVVIAMII
jgi:hypothetical protein